LEKNRHLWPELKKMAPRKKTKCEFQGKTDRSPERKEGWKEFEKVGEGGKGGKWG